MRTAQSSLELRGRKVTSVATFAVAASLLQGGRTAHSVFKIPIPCDSESVCTISMESALAAVIREADLITWDEVVICVRYCIEAVDQTLGEIMGEATNLFGGKFILYSCCSSRGGCTSWRDKVPSPYLSASRKFVAVVRIATAPAIALTAKRQAGVAILSLCKLFDFLFLLFGIDGGHILDKLQSAQY